MLLDINGRWQNWLTLNTNTIGLTYFVTRGRNLPVAASLWLNLRVRYSDGSMSPELWYYLSRFSLSFPERATSGVTISLLQDSRILNSTQPRMLQAKGYAKRHAVEQSPLRTEGDYEYAKLNTSYFILDGYTINEDIIL